MPSTIILVPDIYFRNWDERPGGTSGEMWLCLRPMIATGRRTPEHPLGDRIGDFLGWAGSPHSVWDGPNKRYAIKSPHELHLGMRVCGEDEVYLPINLPSDLDVQIRIGRRDAQGNELPEQRIDLKRTLSCKVVAGAQAGEDALGPYGPGAKPFAWMFNQKVADQFTPLLAAPTPDQGKIEQASFAFLQQMEAGRRIRFTAAQVGAPYNDPETRRPVLESNPTHGLVTTVYWFMGLMVRLGTQADLAALRRIDRVDIALRDGSPVDYDMVPFPDSQGGPESAYDYFQKVGVGFAHSLTTVLNSHESRIYVGPGFRGLQRVDPAPSGTSLWVMESEGPQAFGESDASVAAHGGLARLAAIELRGNLKPDPSQGPGDHGNPPPLHDIGNSLSFVPGLYVTGTLKRYRRFPDVAGAAGTPLRVTVMTFEPDPAMAGELARLRDAFGDAGLRSLLTATVNGWRFKLLHGGVLPWDGPNPIYRMLAIPSGTAAAAGSLTCQEKSVSFFLPALSSPLAMRKVGVRHLWDPRQWGAIPSALALEQRWASEAGPAWKGVRVNALQVRGIDPAEIDRASAHAMLLDEFDLLAAESPLRLEKILAVTALSPRMAALENLLDTDPRSFDPLRDYEDDFINLNTARVWRPEPSAPAGEAQLEEALLRSPQQAEADPVQCRVGGAQRRQTIPLLHAWPFEPLDLPKAQLPATVDWKKVRDEIARRYDLIDEPDEGPYRIDLEHSYGDRRAVTGPDGAALRFNRSARRSWPVELPTFVEAQDKSRFVTCKFVPGGSGDAVELTFDYRFLIFPDLTADAARKDERYTLALSAWRAIAELASPGATLALHIIPATFDVLTAFQPPGSHIDPAQVAAERGFAGGWASGIAKGATIPVNGGSDLTAIQAWARSLVGGATPAAATFRVRLGPGVKPGEKAHLLRVDLEIVRNPTAAPVPADTQVLAPISQQPGLFQVSAETMQGAWADLGFGPTLGTLGPASAGPVWPQLDDARTRWTKERSGFADSVTPEALPPLPAAPAPPQIDPDLAERKKREVQAALIAALDGSDWFAPAGAGPRDKKLAVEPVLLPVGFAPCRPHITLKQQTQDALQRLMTALRDTIDLAFPSWTTLSESDWETHFDAIAALAREATPQRPAGLLIALADMLVDRLLFPEPDSLDIGNAVSVRELAVALRTPGGSDLKWFASNVRRRLLADPALFTDAKALLLTAINFVPNPFGSPMPPPTALAGARFNRLGIDLEHDREESTTTLTLDNLIFVGKSPAAPIEERLAFLEPLDDARYGDAFELPAITTPAADYVVDSYEELVDPRGGGGGWPQRPAVLPLAAANDGRAGRIVHLASRALVSPPLLRFAGEGDQLDAALANAASDWCVENLERGRPGIPATNATRLRIAALLRKPALPRTVERGVSFTLYRVTGDEEKPQVFEKAFANDSFFLRLKQSDYARSAQPEAVAASGRELASEPLLRDLLFAGVGSDLAAEAIRKLALAGTDYAGDLAQIVATGDARLPDPDYALIRLLPNGAGWKLDVSGPGAQATIDAIRHVALFKPDGAGSSDVARTAYLLVGFETTVWAPLEAELCHGRNLPQDRWAGPAAAIDAPRFAPQFWQSVAQDAPASRHSLERRARANEPRHWKIRPTHVIKLSSAWRAGKSPRELVEMLLFETGHAIGDNQLTPSILSAASKARIFDQQLSIQIAQEQFGEDPTPHAEPLGNFPLAENLLVGRKPTAEPGPVRWFDPLYDQFSISLRWFAPSGTSLLALERIFVEFV